MHTPELKVNATGKMEIDFNSLQETETVPLGNVIAVLALGLQMMITLTLPFSVQSAISVVNGLKSRNYSRGLCSRGTLQGGFGALGNKAFW